MRDCNKRQMSPRNRLADISTTFVTTEQTRSALGSSTNDWKSHSKIEKSRENRRTSSIENNAVEGSTNPGSEIAITCCYVKNGKSFAITYSSTSKINREEVANEEDEVQTPGFGKPSYQVAETVFPKLRVFFFALAYRDDWRNPQR